MVQFRILGPVRAFPGDGGDDLLEPLQPLQKLFLAVLVAAAGQPVTIERLIDQIWGSYLTPRSRLQTCAYRVRTVLRDTYGEADPVPSQDGAYRLAATPEQLDVCAFRSLAAQAQAAARRGDDAAAAQLARQALTQWAPHGWLLHGPEPLAGLPGTWADGYRRTLRREYHDTLLGQFQADLRRGLHERMLPRLAMLADSDDEGRADEQLAGLLMRAAYRSGRQAEALHAYRRLQDALKRQGLEPGKEVRMLEERIHRQDPALELGAGEGQRDQESTGAREDPEGTDSTEDPAGGAVINNFSQNNLGYHLNVSQGGTQNITYGGK